jgi:ABC-type transporter Mla maintaining outer membrane lipid asymmetry permease subunit MlaE
MPRIPTAPVVAGSLIGGYLVARQTKKRPLGGAVLAAGGAVAVSQWRRQGPVVTGVLLATYLGGFGASHPLAKKIGAWPSVLTVAGVAGAASYVLADRRG